jgi:hypothetical protein
LLNPGLFCSATCRPLIKRSLIFKRYEIASKQSADACLGFVIIINNLPSIPLFVCCVNQNGPPAVTTD